MKIFECLPFNLTKPKPCLPFDLTKPNHVSPSYSVKVLTYFNEKERAVIRIQS